MLWVQVQAVARLARGDGPFWVFHWQPREKQPDPRAPAHDGPVLSLADADDLGDDNAPGLPWWPEHPASTDAAPPLPPADGAPPP